MRQWHSIDKAKTADIIHAVQRDKEGMMFSADTSGSQVAKLPFYRNHHLYRLINYSTLPSYSFEYLGDGKRFYYLDGSPKALAAISAKNDLFLTENNVIDYICFYFRYVLHNNEEIKLLLSPHDHPGLTSLPEEKLQDIIEHHITPAISLDDKTQTFHVTAILDHDGTLVKAHIEVTSQGLVSITDQKMLLLH